MSIDDVEGVASLLRTENINILKRLCDDSLLSRNEFIAACKYNVNGLFLKWRFISELIDLCDKYFGGFDAIEDEKILGYLLKCAVCGGRRQSCKTDATNIDTCCSLLINMGAKLADTYYVCMMSVDIFFKYISLHELVLDDTTYFNIMRTPDCDEKISDWMMEKWESQHIVLSVYTARLISCEPTCSKYLPRMMQLFYDQGIYDLVILCHVTSRYRCADLVSKFKEYILNASHGRELLSYVEITEHVRHMRAAELQNEIIRISNNCHASTSFSQQNYDQIIPILLEIVRVTEEEPIIDYL